MKKKMRKFADGGFSAAQEEFLGGADRTDPYILARMRAAVPDEKIKESVVEETSEDLDPYGAAGKKPAAVEKTVIKTKVTPSSKSTSFASKDEEGNKLPTDVKKPHIAIPKNAAGMQQYRSDAVSPVERLFKSMMESKSQRSKAAGLNSGGKVKSASARADGCAIRGKTRA
jgi:hypothetical protein